MTVTGTAVPSSSKTLVIPSFFPMIPVILISPSTPLTR
jgi:hypothetical protein